MSRIYPSDILKNALKRQDAHMMSPKDLQQHYQVEIAKGLSTRRAKELLHKNGRNQIEVSYFHMVKSILLGLVDKLSLVLWVSMIMFVLIYQPLGGADPDPKNLINVAMILLCFAVKSALIGVQEIKLMRVMRSLQTMNMTPVSVLRDSKWQRIPAADLVVGDVVEIEANQRVPADMRLVIVKNLRLDKSIMTGLLLFIYYTLFFFIVYVCVG